MRINHTLPCVAVRAKRSRAQDGVEIRHGVAFIPEVRVSTSYYPICAKVILCSSRLQWQPAPSSPQVLIPTNKHLQGFADNDEGATTVCREYGFPYGFARRTADIFRVNAIAVGKCLRHEQLNNCTAGHNFFGMKPTRVCLAGMRAGVHVTCYTKRQRAKQQRAREDLCRPSVDSDVKLRWDPPVCHSV